MKTKTFFGIVALIFLTAISANAQIVVTQGSTHNFKVTTDHSVAPWNYTYLWSTTPTGNVISTPSLPATDIKFDGPAGATTITVMETNPLGGCATPNTFLVTVLGTPTLSFTNATSNGCAALDATLPLTFSVTQAEYFPLVVTYTVAINGAAPVTRTATFASTDALQLALTAADRADLATSAGPKYDIVVSLVSATAAGGNVTIGTTNVNTNTVFDIPDANAIIMVN